jgi:membrane protein implicated in regulation of membrane protease activity
VSDWLWVWIGAAVLFTVIELLTPVMFFSISFAVGAGLAAVIAGLGASFGVQLVAFILGSGVALAVAVPVGRRISQADPDDDPEGAHRWVGRVAVVLEPIPKGMHSTGLVRLERAKWRAETDGDTAIPEGTEVEVIAVRGTRLVVAPVHAH